MSNTDNTKKEEKKRVLIHVLGTDKQFLLLIRHPPCYSYNQVIKNIVGDTGKKENYTIRRFTAI